MSGGSQVWEVNVDPLYQFFDFDRTENDRSDPRCATAWLPCVAVGVHCVLRYGGQHLSGVAEERSVMMRGFDGMGMGWGMGVFGLLILVFLVLAIAALIKYLRT